jgi:hypothetical protein
MAEMPWSGRQGYLDAETVDWNVEGELAGNYKTYGDLTVSLSLLSKRQQQNV